MPAVKDFSKILADIPKGFWVALSHDDEDRVVSFDAKLEEAIRKAKEAGEDDPVVIRVPDTPSALFL
jgi:hypothetical protein